LSENLLTCYSQIRLARAQNSQPAFDFLTGEPTNRPPSREFRQSIRVSSGGAPHREESTFETEEEREKRKRELDELKAEIKTLKYTIDNHRQEDELAKLRHETELRDARRKGEEDFSAKQAAEAEKSKFQRLHDALLKEVTEVKDTAANEKAALERHVRDIQENRRLLEEEIEDLKAEKEESIRSIERKSTELEARNASLQSTIQELQQDSDQRESLLQVAQQQVADRDITVGNLEAEVLRLKAQTGDVETLDVIKRELSEQVTHIRKLEVINREQAAELKHFKKLHKSVEVVEEEKRSLQRKLEAVEGLENELGEARIQRQRLEDERLAWTAYLQSQTSEDGQLEFETPEDLARGLIAERMQTVALLERIGALEPEISARDNTIQLLEADKGKLAEELEKVKSSGSSAANSKLHLRLERQRDLAVREAEFLRAQLKTYDTEDTTFQPETVDEVKQQRIEELEKLLENYKTEVQNLSVDLASKEPLAAPVTGSKRARDEEEENERIGQLNRKKRKLEEEVSTLKTSNKVLQKEVSVLQERLTAASAPRQTRVLSLRSNPTSDFEAIKIATLTALRKENADLLSTLQSQQSTLTQVPLSVLESTRLELQSALSAVASEKKTNDRLRKVWGVKTNEFREAIMHLFGWDIVFMKEGKVRVTSAFYPGSKGENGEENNIVFDMDRGSMKVSGGPQSAFAAKIADQVRFWLKERESIPCFLSALNMEFYEEANRDKTLRIMSD
jgi:mitotic spindle assembly checkpoint protein MAD1